MNSFSRKDKAAFAEALSRGKSPPAAARAAGFTASFGAALLDALISDIGWQSK